MQIVKRMLAPLDRWVERRGVDPFWFYVALFFFALGLLTLGESVWEIRLGRASGGWPGVEGIVTSSKVDTSTHTREKGGTVTTHHPRICYAYTVEARAYESCEYSFGEPGGRRRSEELVAAHPAGRRVAVYYRPDDPGTAVLKRGTVPWSYYVVPGIGVLFATVAGGVVVYMITRPPGPPPTA